MTTTTPTNNTTTVSAPGKALLAGGYLVLESPNPGLVVATDSCFHVTIAHRPEYSPTRSTNTTPIPVDEGLDDTGNNNNTIRRSFRYCPLDVYSPQFHEIYTYWLRIYHGTSCGDGDDGGNNNNDDDDSPLVQLIPRYRTQPTNSYVEKTVLLAMSFTLLHPSININTSTPTSPTAEQQQQQHPIIDQIFRTYPPNSNHTTNVENNQHQPQQTQQSLAIKLRADNDFYSPIPHLDERNLSYLPKNVSSLPPFVPCPIDDGAKVKIHKTGLGSSAALVTSLVAAILSHFQITALPSSPNDDHPTTTTTITTTDHPHSNSKRIIHNLAQISHSIAQGKIGSGFDVSAAVHGTHVYKRFNPNHIRDLMDDLTSRFLTSTTTTTTKISSGMEVRRDVARRLVRCVTGNGWDATADPLHLPKGVELMMADVCGGSESPSMAKKVLAWKKTMETKAKTTTDTTTNANDDENDWKKLEQLNEKLRKLFKQAAVTMTNVDDATLRFLARFPLDDVSTVTGDAPAATASTTMLTTTTTTTNDNNLDNNDNNDTTSRYSILQLRDTVLPTLQPLRQTIRAARIHLKQMGLAANVPIEPEEQSRLADATMDLPGVIAAGVPGAGGYDALFVLYIEGGVSVERGRSSDDDAGKSRKQQKVGEGSVNSTSSGGSRNTDSTVRDQIGQLWLDWCEKERENGRRGLVCPLACKSAGFGGMHGLHQSNLPW